MDDTESLSLDEKETSTGESKVAGEEGEFRFICGLHSGEDATGPTREGEVRVRGKYLGGGVQKFQQELWREE